MNMFGENLHGRQLKKSALVKNAMTFFFQQDVVLKKEPRSHKIWRSIVEDILDQQQQNMLISQKKERSRDRAAVAYTLRRGAEKRKDYRSWTSKGSCSKGGQCSFQHDPAKKGKGKGT